MIEGIVASSSGDWVRVVEIIGLVSGESSILLAEDSSPLLRPRFEPLDPKTLCAPLPRGRVFNKTAEIRWRQTGEGLFTITYLSETVSLPEEQGFVRSNIKYNSVHRSHQKLFGKRSNRLSDWVEVSVPGISQTYHRFFPAEPLPSALQIDTVDYVLDGLVCLTRFCGISEFKGL
ncbi:MAG: hypothetical protein DMF61_23400 [Blastocatellia bacterium AA13]|nr:MAG: hypothetical protein DMF61_23400 [Blastocatellia bacterium AA13]